ncbi:hypothetical protein GCM10023320_31030 [Pseudonocardia adelaidensis]|uniref:Uncharacterized protein n=1 Tax=Pseudonocardia adelaidensis TaxID=648754 RepID=A0ABP9NLX3_9PSEU
MSILALPEFAVSPPLFLALPFPGSILAATLQELANEDTQESRSGRDNGRPG